MEEITERVTCEDPRAGAFLNEVKVVVSLAMNGNEPSYVARIADLPPKLTSLRGGEAEATKPGIKAACIRLTEAGILRSEVEPAPKRGRTGTAHFSIVPTLDSLYAIYSRLGPGVLDEVRATSFGSSVITSDIDRYLAKQLGVALKQIQGHRPELETSIFFARHSTKALAVLLTYTRPMATSAEKGRAFDLGESILRLKDIMHLAFLFDIASSKDMGEAGGIKADVSVSSEIEYGELRYALNSHLRVDGRA